MKRIVIVLLMFIKYGYAQEVNSLYLSSALELGNYIGMDGNITFISKNKLSVSVGAGWMLHEAENYPDDIDDSDDIGFSGIDGSAYTYLTAGKIVQFKKSNRIRLNLSGGLVMMWSDIEENYVRGQQTDHGYYYDYDRNSYQTIGLILNPRLEISVFSMVGLHISPKVILNQKKSFYGIGFGFMLGKLRKRLY
ncbi:hypothetical protein QVZ41_13455 [Wenyingzhuangia sp. chi5]|uniref:Outer membrane protein beta-barrel domain-containing protein n=1 Tax=Wenyingzhuangia gilva TaxID=3057677 RepID=A0ABT8VV72_9FLAO|nr:hypothetical protein [Wenyingzhuangia sp. chi5]MDO3695851.1 hypothetical protein [Wenyingzhuangia sp. chi5]